MGIPVKQMSPRDTAQPQSRVILPYAGATLSRVPPAHPGTTGDAKSHYSCVILALSSQINGVDDMISAMHTRDISIGDLSGEVCAVVARAPRRLRAVSSIPRIQTALLSRGFSVDCLIELERHWKGLSRHLREPSRCRCFPLRSGSGDWVGRALSSLDSGRLRRVPAGVDSILC